MPETLPFQRNRARKVMLAQQLGDLVQRRLAIARQDVGKRMPGRRFTDTVFDMNVTNPLGEL